MSQNEQSTIVVTAGIPRELREQLRELAEANYHSTAAEIRRACVEHVERARAGLVADVPASSRAGTAARTEATA